MNINKAHWTTEGDSVKLSMPFAKVDVERRIVSGFATLDNVDKQGDIVSTEASLDAFRRFRGNLREMHQPIAVGKVLYFKEDRYFDPESKKFYKGVYVSTYVSKGAQDTWEKVLDGTYTGFSIGGNITRTEDIFDEDSKKIVRMIKEYDLFELSIVDNPANQFATILSVQKMNGENVIDGYLSKTEIDNVFWCKGDDIVHVSSENDSPCPVCSTEMKNIGFIEKSDSENPEMIKFLVDSAKGIRTIKMVKEEDPMTEETTSVESSEVTTDEVAAVETTDVVKAEGAEEVTLEEATTATDTPETETEAEVTETAETEETEKVAEVSEDAEAVTKSDTAIAEAVSEIKDSLTNAFGDLVATVKSISDAVAELQKSLSGVSGDVASVTSKVSEVASEVSTVKGAVSEFGKRVDAVEQDTAFRKSGDLGEIVQEHPSEKMEKSLWGGRFLKTSDLFN